MHDEQHERLIAGLAADIVTYTGCADDEAWVLAQQFYEQLWQHYNNDGLIYGSGAAGMMRWLIGLPNVRDESAIRALSERLRPVIPMTIDE